jgi:hypothetical protein
LGAGGSEFALKWSGKVSSANPSAIASLSMMASPTGIPEVEFFVKHSMPDLDNFGLSGPFRSPPAVVVLGSTTPKISAFG